MENIVSVTVGFIEDESTRPTKTVGDKPAHPIVCPHGKNVSPQCFSYCPHDPNIGPDVKVIRENALDSNPFICKHTWEQTELAHIESARTSAIVGENPTIEFHGTYICEDGVQRFEQCDEDVTDCTCDRVIYRTLDGVFHVQIPKNFLMKESDLLDYYLADFPEEMMGYILLNHKLGEVNKHFGAIYIDVDLRVFMCDVEYIGYADSDSVRYLNVSLQFVYEHFFSIEDLLHDYEEFRTSYDYGQSF